MTDRHFPQLFYGLLSLAVAILLAAALGSFAVRDLRRAADEVEVTGSARRPVRSDFVVWRPSVSAQSPDLPSAYAAVRAHADRVRALLRERGVADSVIVERPVETYAIPEFRPNGGETGRVLGYRLTQTFELRSGDVTGVAALARPLQSLITEGVPLVTPPPEFLYTKLASIRAEILAEATRDARERAVEIARSAGGDVGSVRRVRSGVFQITPRNSTEVSDYGIYDTSSLEKDVTAVVRVTFRVD